MEERCKNCKRICKWLDAADKPEIYYLKFLDAEIILRTIEQTLKQYKFKTLAAREFAYSQGNQLAVTFTAPLERLRDSTIVLVAQCEPLEAGVNLWFRFGVDEEFCEFTSIMDEFHHAVSSAVAIVYCDSLIKEGYTPEQQH
ncbi:MAG TPA: hypothetical protein V6C89_11695 [Drouetiella sp.]|jgi:hypothetical protein